MVHNKKEIDKNGTKITERTKVRITNPKYMDMPFESQEKANEMAELFTRMDSEGKEITFVHIADNRYRLYEDGEVREDKDPYSVERTPFMTDAERDIPEMNIKRGDKVLVFGFEGSAAGVCRYDPENLEVIK